MAFYHQAPGKKKKVSYGELGSWDEEGSHYRDSRNKSKPERTYSEKKRGERPVASGRANPKKGPFQKYAISVPDLTELDLSWRGQDLFVQNASMVKDYGVFDDPDTFFTIHKQTWSKVKDFAYVHYGRKVMNRNVARMRKNHTPQILY